MKLLLALSLTAIAAASYATVFGEAEPNNGKAAANPITLAPSDQITGSTADATADYFRVKTGPVAVGIYRYVLTATPEVAGGPLPKLTIRGLNQVAGVIGATDVAAQTGANNKVAWYGFGKDEELYIRAEVNGTAGGYALTLTRTAVTMAGAVSGGGSATFSTADMGHTTNTDMWLYNGIVNPLAGNDNFSSTVTQSQFKTSLAPGTYYLAICTANLANNLASPANDANRNGAVLDFPNVLICSSPSGGTPLDLKVMITTLSSRTNVSFNTNTTVLELDTAALFEIKWVKFTVPQLAGIGLAFG